MGQPHARWRWRGWAALVAAGLLSNCGSSAESGTTVKAADVQADSSVAQDAKSTQDSAVADSSAGQGADAAPEVAVAADASAPIDADTFAFADAVNGGDTSGADVAVADAQAEADQGGATSDAGPNQCCLADAGADAAADSLADTGVATPDAVAGADVVADAADATTVCPTCLGADYPGYQTEDVNTKSAKYKQTYGLAAFKGKATLVALLSAG